MRPGVTLQLLKAAYGTRCSSLLACWNRLRFRPTTLLVLFCCCLPLFAPAPLSGQGARPASIRFRNLKSGPHLFLRDIASFYGMKYTQQGKNISLQSKFSSLKFTQDSRIFQIQGLEANLSFAIARDRNEMLVSQSDFQYFIDPVLRRHIIPRRRIRHIMLDPGHGGNDPGTQHHGVVEKNVNLVLSRRMASILRKRGYQVSMTRNQDRLVRLEQRTALAGRLQPDLFLSIHCNAISNSSIKGIETYVINPALTPSSGGNVMAKKASPGNQFNLENALLGFLLQKSLLSATGADDRGIKRKQFYVIREVACPAALLELGFLSNPAERVKLLESYYQDKLAVAVCDAIQEYEKTLLPPAK